MLREKMYGVESAVTFGQPAQFNWSKGRLNLSLPLDNKAKFISRLFRQMLHHQLYSMLEHSTEARIGRLSKPNSQSSLVDWTHPGSHTTPILLSLVHSNSLTYPDQKTQSIMRSHKRQVWQKRKTKQHSRLLTCRLTSESSGRLTDWLTDWPTERIRRGNHKSWGTERDNGVAYSWFTCLLAYLNLTATEKTCGEVSLCVEIIFCLMGYTRFLGH